MRRSPTDAASAGGGASTAGRGNVASTAATRAVIEANHKTGTFLGACLARVVKNGKSCLVYAWYSAPQGGAI